ncbi:MAG TPA: hypothetical protein VGF67_09650 [Ktedonobacteraceae bacterium]|jgi:hypothetical protein
MTELYKPKIKPATGIGYEGDSWKNAVPASSPYEFGYIPLSSDPGHFFWTWGVFAVLYKVGPDIIHELKADGWEAWSDETIPSFFHLHNQGSQVLIVQEETFLTQDWARKEDLHFARRCPVALAHRAQRHLSETKVFKSLRIGSCALVDDGGKSRVYYLEQLEKEASVLCEMVNEGIGLALTGNPAQNQAWRRAHWPQTHNAARLLAKMYWGLHLKMRPGTIRPLQEVGSEALPMIPNAIRGNALLTAIGSPMQALLAAYTDGQQGGANWQGRADKTIPMYTQQGAYGKTRLTLYPPEERRELDEKALDALWDEVARLSDYDGDVLLILAAQQIIGQPDERGYVWITGKAILDYRNIEPMKKRRINGGLRRAGYRTKDQGKIATIMARMGNSWVQVEEWIIAQPQHPPAKKARTHSQTAEKRTLYTREDRLLDIGSIIRQQESADGEDEAAGEQHKGMPIAWQYRLGSWIDPFLSGANRQVAWLFQQALRYDPYRNGPEKRVARHLSWHFLRCARPEGIDPLVCGVGELLAIMRIVPHKRYPLRARKRMEDALHRLQEDQLIANWSYEAISAEEIGQQKKWLPGWITMAVRIEIKPPASPLALLEIALSPRLEGRR